MPTAVGWIVSVGLFLVALLIPAVVFWFVMLILELMFDKILMPLYYGRNWYPRCRVLEENAKIFYEQWIAVDPEECENYEKRKAADYERWEREKQQKEELIRSMSAVYAPEQKEYEDYRKRLHQWTTEEDSVDWTGKGNGI